MPDAPLRTNWFHILAALAEEDLHGSGIVRDVLTQTDGARHLWPTTLYRTLDEMGSSGLIIELTDDSAPAGTSAKRRYYRITPQGRDRLRGETDRLAALVGTARRRLGEA